MTELLLSSQPIRANQLESQCGVTGGNITGLGCVNPDILNAHTPYLMCENPTTADRDILRLLSARPVSRELTNLSLSLGEDNTLAVAEIYDRLKPYKIGLMGASTSVYGQRLNGFGDAVKNYQNALMDYRKVMKGQQSSATRTLARQKAITAFQRMQIGFKHELNAVTSGIKSSRRGTPLTNPTRAVNIARSSRNVAKLDVTSRVQASRLARLGSHAKLLGNGLAVIDFGNRIGNIHNSYQSGENWERDLFIESSSFALSAGTGIVAAKVGTALLGIMMVATPVGWVGLIIGGIAVAGIAAGTSIGVNSYAKSNSGNLYDYIMGSID